MIYLAKSKISRQLAHASIDSGWESKLRCPYLMNSSLRYVVWDGTGVNRKEAAIWLIALGSTSVSA